MGAGRTRTAAPVAAVFLFALPCSAQEIAAGRGLNHARAQTEASRAVARTTILATAKSMAPSTAQPKPQQGDRTTAGRTKAAACQACHGLDGLAKLPDAPHLAGQPAAYLERALRAYRSGERRNEVMSLAAKPLSDEDIRDLAAYFASIQIEVKSRP